MSTITSKDGTRIAYETHGSGPVVILVDGAMGYRGMGFGSPLVELLSKRFTVYNYDRRGRGESSNSRPFSVDREIEDIEALIDVAGGNAYVYGISSGACLALEAALKLGGKIKKLALYEPPYDSDPSTLNDWQAYWDQLHKLVAANRRGEAIELFMHFVGTPPQMIDGMKNTPAWAMLESVAPTLTNDAEVMGKDRTVPVTRAAALKTKTLVMDGALSMQYIPFMHASALALSMAIPNSQQRTLEGQSHDVKAEALAPVLVEFFTQ